MAKILTKNYDTQEFTLCANGDERAYIVLSLMYKLTNLRGAKETGISLSNQTFRKIVEIEKLIKELI